MPKLIVLTFLLFQLSYCDSGNSAEVVRAELIEMARIDQEFRSEASLASSRESLPPEELMELVDEQNRIDDRNTRRLVEIVNQYGWPGISQFGEAASDAAQLIVQHSPTESQSYLIPFLRTAVSEGEADPGMLAMLEDSILVAEGKEQMYGTEIVSGADGPMLYPVHDPQNIDKRREAVGLPPILDYIELGESRLGRSIDISTLNPN